MTIHSDKKLLQKNNRTNERLGFEHDSKTTAPSEARKLQYHSNAKPFFFSPIYEVQPTPIIPWKQEKANDMKKRSDRKEDKPS